MVHPEASQRYTGVVIFARPSSLLDTLRRGHVARLTLGLLVLLRLPAHSY